MHALARVEGVPLAVVARVAAEPPDPRRDVDHRGRPHHRQRRERAVLEERPEPPAAHPRGPPGPHVPPHRHQPERGQEEQARPLGARREAERQARDPPPRSPPEPRAHPLRPRAAGEGADLLGEDRAAAVAVDEQRREAAQGEEHDDDVEDAGARHDEVRALEGEEERRDAAQRRRAEHPPGNAPHDAGSTPCPSSATEKRHPSPESEPNSPWPTASTHLPTGGWTTMSPSIVEKTSGLPPVKALSGSLSELSTRISTPKRSIEYACLT